MKGAYFRILFRRVWQEEDNSFFRQGCVASASSEFDSFSFRRLNVKYRRLPFGGDFGTVHRDPGFGALEIFGERREVLPTSRVQWRHRQLKCGEDNLPRRETQRLRITRR